MAIKNVPLDIPPGVVIPGTDYQAKGRWIDSDLIRWWEDGKRGPVRGWTKDSAFDNLYDIVYLHLSGAGSISAPDHADFDPGTDLDLVVVIQADDYTPSSEQVLIDKLDTIGGGGYRLSLLSSGQLRLYWDNGAAQLSEDSGVAVTPPTEDWEALAIYVQLDVDNGSGGYDVHFYAGSVPAGRSLTLAADPALIGFSEFTQYYSLLATVTGGATTSVVASTQNPFIGDTTGGIAGNGFEGRIYHARLVDETVPVVLQDDADSSFVSGGHTWTVNGDGDITFSKDGTQIHYISSIVHWVSDGLVSEWLIGTPSRLWHYDGTLTEITPSGFSTGGSDYSVANNWTDTWGAGLFGEDVVLAPTVEGDLFYYDSSAGTLSNLTTGSGAPSAVVSTFVTPERFIVTLGNYNDPRKVTWADQESTSVWAAASTNQAGDKILDGRGNLLRGVPLEEESLIFGETDLHVMRYVGGTFVYGFRQVGSDCGIVGPNAVATVQDQAVFWMGRDSFYTYRGAVQEIECPVRSYVFDDINLDNRRKVYAQHFPQTDEIFWFFCSEGSPIVDKYVKFNYSLQVWDVGTLPRTAGISLELGFRQSLKPHMSDPFGNIYTHETGNVRDDENGVSYIPFLESGPVELGEGDRLMSIQTFVPDSTAVGALSLTIYGRKYPRDTETTHGPYTPSVADVPVGVRATARQFRFRFDEVTATDWALGTYRLRVALRGRR